MRWGGDLLKPTIGIHNSISHTTSFLLIHGYSKCTQMGFCCLLCQEASHITGLELKKGMCISQMKKHDRKQCFFLLMEAVLSLQNIEVEFFPNKSVIQAKRIFALEVKLGCLGCTHSRLQRIIQCFEFPFYPSVETMRLTYL